MRVPAHTILGEIGEQREGAPLWNATLPNVFVKMTNGKDPGNMYYEYSRNSMADPYTFTPFSPREYDKNWDGKTVEWGASWIPEVNFYRELGPFVQKFRVTIWADAKFDSDDYKKWPKTVINLPVYPFPTATIPNLNVTVKAANMSEGAPGDPGDEGAPGLPGSSTSTTTSTTTTSATTSSNGGGTSTGTKTGAGDKTGLQKAIPYILGAGAIGIVGWIIYKNMK